MDEALFRDAKDLYDAGDYRASAKGFLAAAGTGTEGNGAAYHLAGNSLLRLRRHSDAVTVYGHALKDETYEKRGAVRSNLAAAYCAIGEYANAVSEYEAALEEPDYTAQYKALQGMAGALLEMGKIPEAATAYRQAALDGDNPDPGKALNNLGLCFMAMNRPVDAIEAYKAALGFDDYSGRGRALANLGIVYTSLDQHEEAVKAFERATELHGHELSGQALAAYEASSAALNRPEREVVDGWSTGEMPPVVESADDSAETTEVMEAVQPVAADAEAADEPDTDFFTMTDDEMKAQDREARRAERRDRRDDRDPWRLAAMVFAVVVVVIAVIAAAYFSGLGFPTQQMTVNGMLEARAEGEPVDGFWVAVPSADVDKEMSKLPPLKEYQIDGVDRSPRTSRVVVTVTPENGAPLRYEMTLAREGVGWKVAGIENDWDSTDDS